MRKMDESSPIKIDGRSVLGFLLTSPDLVSVSSPDIRNQMYRESLGFSKDGRTVISVENGIGNSFRTSPSKIENLCTEASFELVAPESLLDQDRVGPTGSVECEAGLCFPEDGSFSCRRYCN